MKALIKYFINWLNYRRQIIQSNTGISSKSYVMISGMRLTRVIVFWYLSILTIEMFTDYVLRSNWLDFVAVITALAVFVLASAWGKVKGEQNYWQSYDQESKIDKEIEKSRDINEGDGVG